MDRGWLGAAVTSAMARRAGEARLRAAARRVARIRRGVSMGGGWGGGASG